MTGYDLIGDIHGHAPELRALLGKLGYTSRNGCYRHPDRTAIFLGDFIDRGPRIRETLRIVRAMIDAGSALAVMGNHEYNAIAYHTPDGHGGHLRPHSEKNRRQHAQTLAGFAGHPRDWNDYLAWFWKLPLYLDLPGLRVIHACWDDALLQSLTQPTLTEGLLIKSARQGRPEHRLIEVLLKGKEIPLPAGATFPDKDGTLRDTIRIRWWANGGLQTYREAIFPPSAAVTDAPVPDHLKREIHGYAPDAPPVFFGHYWLTDAVPRPVTANLACLDYSVAKGGRLVAYRWDGERQLDAAKFVAVDSRCRLVSSDRFCPSSRLNCRAQ